MVRFRPLAVVIHRCLTLSNYHEVHGSNAEFPFIPIYFVVFSYLFRGCSLLWSAKRLSCAHAGARNTAGGE